MVYAAVSVVDGQMDSLVLPRANTTCMQLFLDEIRSRYPRERMVMVVDGAGWHRSKSLAVPDNMRLMVLPPYSPELNPVENVWEEIREKFFHNRVFSDMDRLEDQLVDALVSLEANNEKIRSITAWPWIINANQK